MFIPISTDTSIRRTPWVNYGLIAANVLVFVLPLLLGGSGRHPTPLGMAVHNGIESGVLHGEAPRLYQFITYQFLHANTAHIFGNMLFLWIFGNSVNAKMGHRAYLLFYLAGGVFAATGFLWLKDNSLVGASGSIAAVTTAYLALFPRSNITILYWWFLIGTFQLPSMWMIVFKLILWDNILMPKMAGESQVAFDAHLAGYAFGFLAVCGMLALHLLPRDQFDIVALWRRWWSRSNMRSALSTPEAQARAQFGRVARPITVDSVQTVETTTGPTDRVSQLRLQIAEALAHNDRDSAAALYEQILETDPRQVLARQQQLDVANQLYTRHRLPQAAAAYEKYLTAYGQVIGDEAVHVRLLLGIIYARDLQQYDVAEGHLLACLGQIADDRRRQQCVHWLNTCAEALGHPMPPT
ncbi:MAG TPA: rhomboid family intramembrane serine protease, partial [Phycisphaerae bacterium]|nr:rhomboid family intramembrane serine protease [Phycisphaerae bacterium]